MMSQWWVSAKQFPKQFSFLAPFIKADNPGSSALTQKQLCRQPKEKGLITDLEYGRYFNTAQAMS